MLHDRLPLLPRSNHSQDFPLTAKLPSSSHSLTVREDTKSLIVNELIAKFSHCASPAPLIATWKDILSPDELEQMPNFDLHLFKAYLQRKYSELIGKSPL